jgi:phosphoglycolate phosphatase
VIRGVIFDLDGTLLDSIGDIGGAMNATLAAHGFPTHSIDAYLRKVGDGIEMLAKRALPINAPVDLREFIDDYRQRYAERMEHETRPYDGVPAMLDALAERNVPMAVLSNKREDFTVELVKRQLPKWSFVEVRGERTGVPRKPDPQAALALAQVLGLEADECAFVGDTPIDVKTAVAAGMVPVAVLWGFRTKEELTMAGAKHTLAKPGELLELI